MSRAKDIPQDVWEAALAAQDAAIERCEDGKLAYRFPTCNGKAVLDEEIARAILAERERCAKVCDEAEKQCLDGRNEHPIKSEMRILNQGAMTLARDLARAIRGEPT